ncbi:MAG: Clp protease N-terminal domain-containing protein, partial [OM182 bacterium]
MDKLTSKLQSALADAQSLALGKENNMIAPAHLMHALVQQRDGSVRPLLSQTGFNLSQLEQGLATLIDDLPRVADNGGEVGISPEMSKLLNQADKFAQTKSDSFVSSELVLLAAMHESGALGKLLNSFGVSAQALETAAQNLRGGANVDGANAEDSWQALSKFCVDLTARAAE